MSGFGLFLGFLKTTQNGFYFVQLRWPLPRSIQKIFILYSYRYSLNYLHQFFNPIILLYHDPL